MKQLKSSGNQKSATNVKRDSLECIVCKKNNTCKFKSSLIIFEEQNNVEIDCWLRNYDKSYVTGYHMPINILISGEKDKKSIVKWQHILNDKYSVFVEQYLYN